MFWNDPHLYGASFPYKEIPNPIQTPFMGTGYPPWQNLPRFVPPFYGYTPQPYIAPQVPFSPFFNPMASRPFEMNLPRFDVPQVPFNPFINPMGFQPFEMNLPRPDVPQVPFNPFINPMAHRPDYFRPFTY